MSRAGLLKASDLTNVGARRRWDSGLRANWRDTGSGTCDRLNDRYDVVTPSPKSVKGVWISRPEDRAERC